MNHYEELAVGQDASDEEIHQAYRALARLLHPDNQPDPKLKSAAERQMIRLNEILATLADPRKRRLYDESLIGARLVIPAAAPPSPPPPAPILHLHRQLPWLLACCILAGAGFWYWRSNESGAPVALAGPVQPAQPAPPAAAPAKSQNRLLRRSPDRLKLSLPAADLSPDANSAPGEPLNPPPQPPEPAVALHVQAPQTIPESPAPSAATAVPPATLAGHWFYASASHDPPAPGMYAPEFIEFFLSEQQGALSGRYWARYRIPDKPVSPEVQFRVSGASQEGEDTTLRWVSGDGASGQMKIELHGANSMEVTWWATAFGQHTALTSGSAVLVRQQAH